MDFSLIPNSVGRRLGACGPVYVACSGGADSVYALLLVYLFLKRNRRGSDLRVLHFDHALRGEDSRNDARFVHGIGESLEIPVLEGVAKWPDGVSKVNEADARDARLAFFRQVCGPEPQIVTGHHADDVVETLLMRLSRGAGVQGLSAPREVSEAGGGLVFLRPLLNVGREQIRQQLRAAGADWREDVTNASDANYRARLRKTALPAWEQAADRSVRAGVSRSRRLLEEDAEALEKWADELWELAWDEGRKALKRRELEKMPKAMRRRILSRLPGGEGIAATALEKVLSALDERTRLVVEAKRGLFYELREDSVGLLKREPDAPEWGAFQLPLGTSAFLPGGERVSFGWVEMDAFLWEKLSSGSNDDGEVVYLSAAGNSLTGVTVRSRIAGDAFKPLGKSSPKKLKDLFIERKIERRDRGNLPIFVGGDSGILWVPGLPPNANMKLEPGSRTALRLTYER
ncbi:tRNA lysidine(34) synthetase TilS [Pelagicoccus mobilis]|uniref:tRNA(Ile)-lysidine synthase n=1 Tax=Pelagicoccus mobilis TaxID=415221 RepID=A0A934S0E3_9BACT|nr:tRNA lysidine(34) synthetase TilS [Pelagicoccus mobilis]MBK1877164.1 tRNA lysidine(34) synthetase TilS [Pelagicoccus mobilis]